MKTHCIGIIMNGVTGRMGTNQHLIRSILAIRAQGGLRIGDGETIVPEPILVGRNEAKLKVLSKAHGDLPYATDLAPLLKDDRYPLYFDAQTTALRYEAVKQAIAAGKHIYCEKPTALNSADAMDLYRLACDAGVRHGVVQDKLWLPGIMKLKYLIDTGFFGRILAVRGEFGYWVFTGEKQTAQRPSWNYRKAEGGGIILDMLCHWRYVIDNLFGNVTGVSCLAANHIPERWDERGARYDSDAEDAAYATFTTDQGIVCHFNSSWCTRVRRDDLLTIQVDGVKGSAVAGLRACWVQSDAETPKPVWNPDIENPIDFRAGWMRMPDNQVHENAFKAQWERFLRHLVLGEPFPWDLKAGAKGVQLAELGYESSKRRTWLDVPDLA
ncbi:MAG TPA: Gfo/Idh/MocA family oxidoreductase [Candidatus Hydrogenedentes bacterium]|nr:Gfo/Idh/MocA family oxidoreductase [Candidatus Hydrogenedentota bacterium]HOT50260.1 Gfo/Idh/MocA family oxidoreductase [Candidatus Hydrogenedentota bacterium]HOV74880.1 Gfo/Idh/MocA family oxidoreductase [Candidatus Hydrogenedentota bacterium]HPC15114.1 Gfo/Idh/MocA family oxidoreductase [Candidatus Hydrogenedentota bacterium]HRT21850.1 Gfo/Idh/MocA family oxidoreductase [Candidatus Hydrogenedentota bacterium]